MQNRHLKALVFCFCLWGPVSPFALADPYADAVPFKGTTLAGEAFSFEPGKLQRPALAVFWASWCTECRYEFHELKKLHRETRDRLDIYGVTVDKDIDKAIAISRRAGLPYVSVFDPNAKIAALYHVRATPTVVLIDRAGKVRHIGHRVDRDFHAVLQGILGTL